MNLHDIIGPRRPPTVAAIPATVDARSGAGPVDGRATRDLRDALEILAEQMHDAVGRRRTSQPGSESFRRADERVAYLIELFSGLQRRTEIPDEIWRLPFRQPA
jgi:hypothetical protein